MGNLNVVVAGSKDFADAVGKKGTVTDMTFFEIKKGNDSVTLIEPSKYPEKLSSLFYGVSMAEYAILVVEKIDSFLGETIVMIDSLGIDKGWIVLRNYIQPEQLKPLLAGTSLEGYEYIEDDAIKTKQVYTDALTHVKNKGAFSTYIDEMQAEIDKDQEDLEFAVGMFDCDDLKSVNDQYGHEKGDLYLKKACHLICCVFPRSPVFRIGGDEFSVILRYEDYMNMDVQVKQFERTAAEITASTDNIWEQVRISMGIAVYDPKTDHTVQDVVRRADEIMYENKRGRKKEEQ